MIFGSEEFTVLERFLDRFGMPVVGMIVGAWALWKAARWFGENVAEPLVKAHTKFLDAIQNNDTQIVKLAEKLASDQTLITNQQHTLVAHQAKLVTVVTDALIEKCSVPHCPIIAALMTIKQQRDLSASKHQP